MNNPYSTYQPMRHTAAPLANRMSNVYAGSESYFTDDEARAVLPEITATFNHIVALRNNPSKGFTRIAACNFPASSSLANGITWVNGSAL
jgi:hypothetical protein